MDLRQLYDQVLGFQFWVYQVLEVVLLVDVSLVVGQLHARYQLVVLFLGGRLAGGLKVIVDDFNRLLLGRVQLFFGLEVDLLQHYFLVYLVGFRHLQHSDQRN